MRMMPWPEDRWEPTASAIRETSGPQRVVTDQPDPSFTPRPIGFAPPALSVTQPNAFASEPDLWEGDQA